jgi:hypothetical protein
MSDTPRTDKAQFWAKMSNPYLPPESLVVYAAFARKLERENERAKKLLDEWEYERVRWNTQSHNALIGYEDRQRAKAYGAVYERCKQQLEFILSNTQGDQRLPEAGR